MGASRVRGLMRVAHSLAARCVSRRPAATPAPPAASPCGAEMEWKCGMFSRGGEWRRAATAATSRDSSGWTASPAWRPPRPSGRRPREMRLPLGGMPRTARPGCLFIQKVVPAPPRPARLPHPARGGLVCTHTAEGVAWRGCVTSAGWRLKGVNMGSMSEPGQGQAGPLSRRADRAAGGLKVMGQKGCGGAGRGSSAKSDLAEPIRGEWGSGAAASVCALPWPCPLSPLRLERG